MKLQLHSTIAQKYKSRSQQARVFTEDWVVRQVFCPNCASVDINKCKNNSPVADFHCSTCKEEYELKSQNKSVGTKIVDGAYRTMIERLQSRNNPNLFLLDYDLNSFEVRNFFVVPKHFFTPEIIERRAPLSKNARRAGWVGCNILLQGIPQIGKIFFVSDKQIEPKEKVLTAWQKTLFLREEKDLTAKGWLLDIMMCIDRLGRKDFSLAEIYFFENVLGNKHPNNRHIKDKIRQQLQVLRDKGYLEFIGCGKYRLT